MASGREKHEERMAIVSSFGKELARRAKSRCELCGDSGVKLVIHEVDPVPKEPVLESCIMVCERCDEQIREERKFKPGEHWRVLAETAWSEVPAVQVAAIRLLRRQADSQAWARETLDGLFLDPEVEEWI